MVTRRGWILFAAMCLVWGIPYFLIKVAVGTFSPPAVVFGRTLIAAVLLVPIVLVRVPLRPLLAAWPALVAYTVVEMAIPWVMLTHAERHLSSSLAGLLVAATPLAGALIALVAGSDERLGWLRFAGLVIGFLGVALLLGFDFSGAGWLPLGEVAVVVVGYALGPLIISTWLKDLPRLGVIATSVALVAIAYSPFALVSLGRVRLSLDAVLAVLVLGLVCTALAFLLFFALIAEVGPARSVVITYVNPAVAIALGVIGLHEKFNLAIALGFLLILLGSYWATRPSPPRKVQPAVNVERA